MFRVQPLFLKHLIYPFLFLLNMQASAVLNPDLVVTDPHSCARPAEAKIQHLDLELEPDFEKRIIKGVARYRITAAMGATALWLDTRGLIIEDVKLGADQKTNYQLMPEQEYLGRPLKIDIVTGTSEVTVWYQTTAMPGALQWLNADQTGDGSLPFLFTQGQAILSRTWFPVQDSPGIRFTWSAKVQVPEVFMVVMSGSNPREKSESGTYTFRMDLPVPAYLIAMAAGNLQFQALGERTGVYAEPGMIKKAAFELADTEKMLETAEKLYGTYQWGRYDLIVLPPSFPFGGMENPRLTFATPTIIAGDRSLTSLVAHELAHSWSGNLVTNATWNDFWLNEGFTVYFERRIMEELYGSDYTSMLASLGCQDLMSTLDKMGLTAPDTRLKLDLKGRDPDDGMNDIAYEKGYFFLCALEEVAGRKNFDAFLREYFKNFAFQSIDTEQFLKYLYKKLPQCSKMQPSADEWIYKAGLPDGFKAPVSSRLSAVDAQLKELLGGTIAPEAMQTSKWSTHEWLHLIRNLPDSLGIDKAEKLDRVFGFSKSGNAEIQAAWFEKMIIAGYSGIDQDLEQFLMRVGRRKFVVPLFSALLKNPAYVSRAEAIFKKARPGYHAVTAGSVDELFKKRH